MKEQQNKKNNDEPDNFVIAGRNNLGWMIINKKITKIVHFIEKSKPDNVCQAYFFAF